MKVRNKIILMLSVIVFLFTASGHSLSAKNNKDKHKVERKKEDKGADKANEAKEAEIRRIESIIKSLKEIAATLESEGNKEAATELNAAIEEAEEKLAKKKKKNKLKVHDEKDKHDDDDDHEEKKHD